MPFPAGAAVPPAIAVPAPAKLNLYLHVLGRRADGYHELDSLVVFAGLHDTVTVRAGTGGSGPSFEVSGPMAGTLAAEPAETNLVVRAARELAAAIGRPCDAALLLDKHLPVASGIGGGSADAAACQRGLAGLWGLEADDPRPWRVAAGLGADVPVCLAGRPSFFGGIGDALDPAPRLPAIDAVLVNPGVPLPTPAVFGARTGPFSPPARFTEAPADAVALARLLAAGRGNDLTDAAIALAPAVGDVLAALGATQGCLLARLSGSGATCFGLYADQGAAEMAATALAAAHPQWWVRATRLGVPRR
ncbi:MAG TPA: 4-(cytidine 5'-diphospho)-2-C-methyl-D-erythritol kinase [Arenibaculum sp.]|nr:4-(cytidine 5'-diphospho)-2-C-methyl-D-erythritol kinase [Arenibaculum sp.]